MSKFRLFVASAIVAASAAATVQAQDGSGFYFSGGIAAVSADDGFIEANTTNIVLRPGYSVNRYFDIEGELGFTVVADTFDVLGVPVDVSTQMVGVYAKGNLPINDKLSAFGRVGVVNGTIKADVMGFGVSTDATAPAYGVGFEYEIVPNTDLRIDATWADFKDQGFTTKTSAISVGVTWRY